MGIQNNVISNITNITIQKKYQIKNVRKQFKVYGQNKHMKLCLLYAVLYILHSGCR